MDIDPSSAPTSRANDAKPPRCGPTDSDYEYRPVESTRNPVSASTQAVTAKTAPRTDCTRLRINYSKAVRTADDGIKIHCPDVETFRSLNNISWTSKSISHTKSKPTSAARASCALGAQTLPQRRLTIMVVLAVLPRTEEAKNIFNNLNMVCGLGYPSRGPHKKGGPGQCHRCQLYGHAAANCHADPRCVKCLVPHWTRECPRTRESGEKPSCVNCLQQHTANYRGCPKAPKFISYNRPKSRPVAPPRDLNNFPDLAGNKPTPPAAASRPVSNPWGKPKPTLPPRAAPGPSGEAVRREPPVSLPLPRPRAPHRLETTSKR
ncbi:Nucleic-acid-binding protein from transposon X-element [Eumeta japonica]|uniref:Nucleic-acid-binding protein from transposon X-element n=1 Tax=Eumeta variegata TaxID=151549 RepID=A0A4C1VRU5_EUMVA|nr:Nucleic-acid-binding protein from transposon X-element [Eumeta japonica]